MLKVLVRCHGGYMELEYILQQGDMLCPICNNHMLLILLSIQLPSFQEAMRCTQTIPLTVILILPADVSYEVQMIHTAGEGGLYLVTPDEEIVYDVFTKAGVFFRPGVRQELQEPSVGGETVIYDTVSY